MILWMNGNCLRVGSLVLIIHGNGVFSTGTPRYKMNAHAQNLVKNG